MQHSTHVMLKAADQHPPDMRNMMQGKEMSAADSPSDAAFNGSNGSHWVLNVPMDNLEEADVEGKICRHKLPIYLGQ